MVSVRGKQDEDELCRRWPGLINSNLFTRDDIFMLKITSRVPNVFGWRLVSFRKDLSKEVWPVNCVLIHGDSR